MVKTMTKKEYAAKYAGRGGHRFRIFHREDGKDVVDFEFWAASRKDAEEELDLYRKKQELVSPVEREYFYKMADVHVCANKDGTVTVADSLRELMTADGGKEDGRWRRALDRVKSWLYAVENFARDFRYMLKDVAFWLGHYDRKSCHGEERADYWDVACMVQRKLLFNVPRLAKNLHGCPQPYVNRAVDAMREAKGLPPAAESDYRCAGNDAMAEGMRLWKAELDRLVLYIKLFQYYDGYGDCEMKEIDAEYRKTLPVHPGTDGEIDYAECAKLADKYWGLYCDLWKKIGRMCWD